jgi:hypothetical protein
LPMPTIFTAQSLTSSSVQSLIGFNSTLSCCVSRVLNQCTGDETDANIRSSNTSRTEALLTKITLHAEHLIVSTLDALSLAKLAPLSHFCSHTSRS